MAESTEKTGETLAVSTDYTLVTDDVAEEKEETQSPTAWSMLRELLETIILALVIFLVVRQGVQNYRIESHSMEPNFYENQFVLVNKLAYKIGEPDRGDVVVFRNPNNENEDYIKRVIGLPGDTVTFRDGETYVNGEMVDDSFTNEPTNPSSFQEIVISPEHYFVMGDNRPNSRDGRVFGPIEDDLLEGKAWLRVWPFSAMGLIDHLDLEPGVPLASDVPVEE